MSLWYSLRMMWQRLGSTLAPREPLRPRLLVPGFDVLEDRAVPAVSPYPLASVGQTRFVSANAAGLGRELWATAGTAATTRLVRDINSGAAGSDPGSFTPL